MEMKPSDQNDTTGPLRFKSFQQWSDAWTIARKEVGDVDRIVRLWHADIPGLWKRKNWSRDWGYRKSGDATCGEKDIEQRLLGKRGTTRLHIVRGPERGYPILSIYHNFPLTSNRCGQVIADALGVVWAGERVRPLLMEVKVDANSPWYAAVECLKQMRLARRDDRNVCRHLSGIVSEVEKGAWGLVFAPKRYFARQMNPCKRLFERLEKTEARIGFVSTENTKEQSDRLPNARLRWVAGNWPPLAR